MPCDCLRGEGRVQQSTCWWPTHHMGAIERPQRSADAPKAFQPSDAMPSRSAGGHPAGIRGSGHGLYAIRLPFGCLFQTQPELDDDDDESDSSHTGSLCSLPFSIFLSARKRTFALTKALLRLLLGVLRCFHDMVQSFPQRKAPL